MNTESQFTKTPATGRMSEIVPEQCDLCLMQGEVLVFRGAPVKEREDRGFLLFFEDGFDASAPALMTEPKK